MSACRSASNKEIPRQTLRKLSLLSRLPWLRWTRSTRRSELDRTPCEARDQYIRAVLPTTLFHLYTTTHRSLYRGTADLLMFFFQDLGECKTMAKPPAGVDDVFAATMVLLAGTSPSVVTTKAGKVKDRSWDASKKQLLGEFRSATRCFSLRYRNSIVYLPALQASAPS